MSLLDDLGIDGELPQMLKLSLGALQLDGCDEADQLQGDYLLSLQRSETNHVVWALRFPAICGYSKINVLVRARHRSVYQVTVVSVVTPGRFAGRCRESAAFRTP